MIRKLVLLLSYILVLLYTIIFLYLGGELRKTLDLGPNLWLPAMVTVIGSFLLYYKREIDKRRATKQSLRVELERMHALETLAEGLSRLERPPTEAKIPKDTVPAAGSFPTSVYEGNINSLGRLNEELAEKVVSFYTKIMIHKSTISEIRTDREEGDELPMAAHKDLYE